MTKSSNARKKCQTEGCTKSAVAGGHCVAHGGGRRCQTEGCTTSAQAGGCCRDHLYGASPQRGSSALKENKQELHSEEDQDEHEHKEDDENRNPQKSRSEEAAPPAIKLYELCNCAAEHDFEDL